MSGVRVVTTWRCVHECDAHGEGPTADKDAEKHTTKPPHHATTTTSRPGRSPR